MLTSFAAETTAPLAAEKLSEIGPLVFTNSMLYGLITAVFVLTLFGIGARASQLWPKSRLAFGLENFTDIVYGLILETFNGDERKTRRHFPLLISLFVFILASNLSGLFPGVGSITVNVDGRETSLLRPFTTDLNSTLALAALSLSVVHVYALKELGIIGRIRHFFPGFSPMKIFIGLLDIMSEVLRLVTLSLRLFGVIYGGKALLNAISALAGNFGWAASVPIIFLEIFFSIVQAYLFMMLTASYLMIATTHEEKGHSEERIQHAAKAGA